MGFFKVGMAHSNVKIIEDLVVDLLSDMEEDLRSSHYRSPEHSSSKNPVPVLEVEKLVELLAFISLH